MSNESVVNMVDALQGGDNVAAVLEINGGLARRMGIVVGSEMRHPSFVQNAAIWPCSH